MQAQLKINEEEKKEVQKACEEAESIDLTPDAKSGHLVFSEYLKVFSIVLTLQVRLSLRVDEAHRQKRRALLAAGN